MAKSSNYWDNRAIQRLTEAEKQSKAYINRVKRIYEQAYKNIDKEIASIYRNYTKETGFDTQKLKELLTRSETQKTWEQMKRQGLDKYILDNYKSRISRLEQLQAQIYAKAKMIYPKEELQNTMCYKGVINQSYYKTMYDTQMGTGYDFNFATLDNNMVKALLSDPWSGKNYSKRIWDNTDILADSLSQILGGAMLSGQSIQKTSKQIRDRFDVSKYYAERLIRTETNHFNNEADAMAYEEMGLDKYVFVATLDNRTSAICQDMDGKIFDFNDREEGVNFPPLHPNCRSKTRAYLGKEAEKTLQRRARNPITGKIEIVDNIPYSEWIKKYKNDDKMVRNTGKVYNKSINRKHKIIDGKNFVGKFDITEEEKYDDGGINRIMEMQGYKGLPKVVNDKDFEKACRESDFFAQRGYRGKTKEQVYQYQDELYNGEWYIDCSEGGSQYGKGMYATGVKGIDDPKAIEAIAEESKHYGTLRKLERHYIVEDITLDPTTKFIDYSDITTTYMKQKAELDKWNDEEKLIFSNYRDTLKKYQTAYLNYTRNWQQGNNIQEYLNDYYKYQKEAEKIKSTQFTAKIKNSYNSIKGKDPSTLAVEMGYDAINVPEHGAPNSNACYKVILNRTKVIIRAGGYYREY